MSTYSTVKAALLNITIKRGNTQSMTIPLSDPDDGDSPVDLSVFDELKMEIRKTHNSPSVVDLSLGSGLSISGVDDSNIIVDLTPTQANQIADGYRFDIKGTITATSFVETVVEGSFVFEQNITQ